MQAKLLTLLAVAAAASAARPNYSFGYAVSDARNDFGHQEARQLENTEGGYHVALPDGRLQQVQYRVDGDSGYLVEVTYDGEARFPDSDESFESLESREFHAPRHSQDSDEFRERKVFRVPETRTFHSGSHGSGGRSFFSSPRHRVSSSTSFFRPGHSSSRSHGSSHRGSSGRSFFSSPGSGVSSGSGNYFFLGSADSVESGEGRVYGVPRSRPFPRPSRVFGLSSDESLEYSFGSDESREHRFTSRGIPDHFRLPTNPFIRTGARYGRHY
ncbi:uncharacterized protein LOC127004802 [Eriocheir sinensis]|uniref:uncharacterized protein LOC127004802 n=1 Tax=Eriocheir sinensis TaxID=95602 RepID=UPI0021C871F4|nr:uncharacterized protein LOC127004802 [Eriocheir sinensis]